MGLGSSKLMAAEGPAAAGTAAAGPSRLLIVSNRLPVTAVRRSGEIELVPSVGGLATGLASVAGAAERVWIGWPGLPSESLRGRERALAQLLAEYDCVPVFLTRRAIARYYHGFCNDTLWPLFHYFAQDAVFDRGTWDAYRHVNEVFCEEVLRQAREGDRVWVHDYQLLLLPELLRESGSRLRVGSFLHIPFPAMEVFRMLPWRDELLAGMLGADLVGFHTYDYARYFVDCVRHLVGIDASEGRIFVGERTVRVDAFPMGIDYAGFCELASSARVQRQVRSIIRRIGGRRVILSVDRLDYTKGIPERLRAFELFLERNPRERGKVTLIMVAVPSRTRVERYARLKREVDELVGRINGAYGSIDWMPIWYLYRTVPTEMLVALYRVADVGLVTPLRDGMNLIAKEFIASKGPKEGVLVLSEMAGAAQELAEAIKVNPNSREQMAAALEQALAMGPHERAERNSSMHARLSRYDVARWARDYLEALDRVGVEQRQLAAEALTGDALERATQAWHEASDRLLFLDYDGTLVPFAGRPEEARPDDELLKWLAALSSRRATEVVLVSGRARATLDEWFGEIPIGLIAEHGAWVREAAGEWRMIEPLVDDWKSEVRPLLDLYVDRTPGSLVEEKAFSLVWHYRRSAPELAALRARELRKDLAYFAEPLGLEVLEGQKVVEVKNAGINKGRAALNWTERGDRDFIMAAGDDLTDEQLFAAMPEGALTVKVGKCPSRARFAVRSVKEMRALISRLVRTDA